MSTKQIIIIAAAMLVVMLISIGASFFIMQTVVQNMMTAKLEEVLPPEMLPQEEEEEEAVEEEELPPPIYVPLEPFIVNFVQEGMLRYLQVTMELMSRDEMVVEEVKASLPEIRNSLILMMSDHDYDKLSSREGKEVIRNEIQAEVNRIIGREEEGGIESVFLTGFVMQ